MTTRELETPATNLRRLQKKGEAGLAESRDANAGVDKFPGPYVD
jgi:hypothetical protein